MTADRSPTPPHIAHEWEALTEAERDDVVRWVFGGRLSVTTALEHVETGHGGKFQPFCYRCQYFEEVRSSAFLELMAIERSPLPWWGGWPHWSKMVGVGSDEWKRRTVWVGPVVIPLWRCRCGDCRAEIRDLRERSQRDLSAEDREKQMGASAVSTMRSAW